MSIAVLFVGWSAPLRASPAGTDLIVMLDMGMDAAQPLAYNLPSQNIINTLAGGARVAAAQLIPGDRISLVTFSEDARTVLPMTSDRSKFESALRKTGKWVVQSPRHHLYDSLLTALNSFPGGAPRDTRRCVLVLTTTSDAGSRHTVNDVVAAAKSKDVAISVALISPIASPPHILPGGQVTPGSANTDEENEEKMLDPVARETGGHTRIYTQSPYVIAKAIDDMVYQ